MLPFHARSMPGIVVALLVAATSAAQEGERVAPPPGELRLADLEAIALEQNPTLVAAGAQVRISRGKAWQAGLYPNPTVGYAAEQIGVEGTAGEFHGMFVEQQLVTGGKLRLSRAKFAQEARQAELQVLAQQFRVLHGVREAYYRVLAEQERARLRKRLVVNSEEIVKTLEELVNVGQANRSDMLQAQIRLQRTAANLQVAERRYQAAWEELAAVTGVPDLPMTTLAAQLDLSEAELLDREATLAELLATSPELQFLQAEVARDRIALRRECVEPIPNVQLRAEAGYNAEAEETVAGVEVGLRLPIFDRNQGTIYQARAELSRAEADVRRMELLLRKRFAETFAEYETARTMVDYYRREVLPKAEEAQELYLTSFRERRAAWPQVLDAEREYYELYSEYWDHALDARLAEAKISTLLLEGGLERPPTPTPEGHRDATPRPR